MDGRRQVRLLSEALARVPHGTNLERVVAAAAPMLGMTDATAILLSDGDGGGVVTSSGPTGEGLVDLEFQLGEGPVTDAFATSVEAVVDDLSATGSARWPVYTAAAVERGVGAVCAVPARLGAIRVGVLQVQRDHPGVITAEHRTDLRAFAEICSTLMVDHAAGLHSDGVLVIGWPNRAVIHQATGMLAAQLAISLAAALARLRAYAFTEGASLESVARDVVGRRLRIEP